MSKKYYKHVDKHSNPAYEMGRDFEYRVTRLLRNHGFHVMRRFGSIGVMFCPKCGEGGSRHKGACSECKTTLMKASLDLTAYKSGVYLMITCKFSKKGVTTFMDDPYWRNLVKYAAFYGAVPLFAGVTATNDVYFVDLRTTGKSLDLWYRFKESPQADKTQMEKLMTEAWSVIDFCNKMISGSDNPKNQARWVEAKIKMINVLNRLLWRAGISATSQDITKMLSELEEGKKVAESRQGKVGE